MFRPSLIARFRATSTTSRRDGTTRARQLRRNQTHPERQLWQALRGRKLFGLKFRRQHPIGPFVAYFYCDAARLVVELDGESHTDRGDYDRRRQRWLESEGYTVVRIANDDVLTDLEPVLLHLARAAGIDIEAKLNPPLSPW